MKRIFLLFTIVATLLVGGLSLFAAYRAERGGPAPLHVVVVGPMSGKSAAKGEAMVNGARLFAERYNAQLAEGGRPIFIAPVDDRNDPKLAEQVARVIAGDQRVVAVLGHRSSAASLRAAPVYAETGLPMIAATATAPMITKGNPWAFRVVPDNDLQGDFIARYVKALDFERVSVVFDRDDFGLSLATAFEEEAEALGLERVHSLGFDNHSSSLSEDLSAIVQRLGERDPGMIFIAAHDREGARLIRAAHDAGAHDWPMIGNASMGKQSFPARFAGVKEERKNPGHYTNGLYAVSSLIFDVAGESAQYFRERFRGKGLGEPDAAAAAYHDAATAVGEALRRIEVGEKTKGIEVRDALRGALAAMNEPAEGVRGVTGLIYFDAEGDVVKSIPVGRYSAGRLVSAPIQLSRVEDPTQITASALEEGFVRELDGEPFHMTHVVYTGIEPVAVTEFDSETLTFGAEFLLWFRSSSAVEPEHMEFLNAVEPVELGEPEESINDERFEYYLYRVKGRFYAEAHEGRDAFGEYRLKVAFRHQYLPQTNLIYVADSIGLGGGEQPWARRVAEGRLFEEVGEWSVNRAVLFQDSLLKDSYGHPELVEGGSEQRAFSRFNLELAVEENHLSLRGLLPTSVQHIILWGSLLALCLVLLAEEAGRLSFCLRGIWSIEIMLGVCVLAAAEPVLLSWMAGEVDRYHLRMTSFVFDLLWWLYLAYALAKAVRLFVWDRLAERTGQHVPNIARHLSTLFIYLLAVYGIIAFVLKQDPTNLLATSGLVAMIVGLALQSNLANVFSGIAISLEKPFLIGDRIRMNFDAGPVIGEVVDMNWRATKIRTDEGSEISMPNGTLANANINNLSHAERTQGRSDE